METALWILVGVVAILGLRILQTLSSIEGRLTGLSGLLSSDGPDPGFTSYQRRVAGSAGAIVSILEKELNRQARKRGEEIDQVRNQWE